MSEDEYESSEAEGSEYRSDEDADYEPVASEDSSAAASGSQVRAGASGSSDQSGQNIVCVCV